MVKLNEFMKLDKLPAYFKNAKVLILSKTKSQFPKIANEIRTISILNATYKLVETGVHYKLI